MLAAVGEPHLAYPVVHIAGTNGKGSVAATAESILRAAGFRTGLYTSPHLISFRERVRMDGAPIVEAALLDAARALWPAVRAQEPSFFEATTAIAFLALARAQVDVAVVEVGLGGRLDATNVVRPDVTVVTQVARDHSQLLGGDVADIAAEKAGIAKPGVPLLTAQTPGPALEAIRRVAANVGAPVIEMDPDSVRVRELDEQGTTFSAGESRWGALELRTPLVGRHQALNAALAVRAIEASPHAQRVDADAVRTGVEQTRWPGRFQVERLDGRAWVFDVAHNPAAMARLTATLAELALPRPWLALVGILSDKEWQPMLRTLATAVDALVLTTPAYAPADRVWRPADALAAVEARSAQGLMRVVQPLEEAVATVRREPGGTVIVTGSFHTVGEALGVLGVDAGWPADPRIRGL